MIRHSEQITCLMGQAVEALKKHYCPIYFPCYRGSWYFESEGEHNIRALYSLDLECMNNIDARLEVTLCRQLGNRTRYLAHTVIEAAPDKQQSPDFYAKQIAGQLHGYRFKRAALELIVNTLPRAVEGTERVYQERLESHRNFVQKCSHLVPYVERAALLGLHIFPSPSEDFLRISPGDTVYYALAYSILHRLRNLKDFHPVSYSYETSGVPLDVSCVLDESGQPDHLRIDVFQHGIFASPHTIRVSSQVSQEGQIKRAALVSRELTTYLRFDFRIIARLVADLLPSSPEDTGNDSN